MRLVLFLIHLITLFNPRYTKRSTQDLNNNSLPVQCPVSFRPS